MLPTEQYIAIAIIAFIITAILYLLVRKVNKEGWRWGPLRRWGGWRRWSGWGAPYYYSGVLPDLYGDYVRDLGTKCLGAFSDTYCPPDKPIKVFANGSWSCCGR